MGTLQFSPGVQGRGAVGIHRRRELQAVFHFIYRIQEEVHRFAISYHRQQRSKRLKYSELDEITGIGPKRKEELLKYFKSITAIGKASLPELERLLPKDAAAAVYFHFRKKENEG